jgi:hypothetical protein
MNLSWDGQPVKRKRFLILAVACLASAQSQPTSSAPDKPGQDRQASPVTRFGDPKDVPSAGPIRVDIPAPDRTDHPGHSRSPADLWMITFTGAIMFATIAQACIYWRQTKLMATALS